MPLRIQEGTLHGQDHVFPGEDVALRGVLGTRAVSGPDLALRTGGRGRTSLGVDDPDLTLITLGVPGEEGIDDRSRRQPTCQELQSARPEGRVGRGLGGDGSHSGARPGHDGTDGEEPALHGDAEIAGGRITGDDGEGGHRLRHLGDRRRGVDDEHSEHGTHEERGRRETMRHHLHLPSDSAHRYRFDSTSCARCMTRSTVNPNSVASTPAGADAP